MEHVGAAAGQKKKIYIEVIRLMAIMMVLYGHTSVNGLMYFNLGKMNRSSQIAIWIYPVIAGSVKLFFMISGALLLRKQENVNTVLKKRFLRFFIVTAVAVLIYYVREGVDISAVGYFNALYKGGVLPQHWFLYSYLSFLLLLPFLQRMVAAISENSLYWYLWGLAILFELGFPLLQLITGFNSVGLITPLLEQIVFYPLLGYFLDSRVLPACKDKRYLPAVIGAAVLLVVTVNYFMDRHSFAVNGTMAYAYWFNAIIILGIYLLVCLTFAQIRLNDRICSILTFLGNGVFGTYLLEDIIRDKLFFLLEDWVYKIPEYFACWLWILVCVLCGILITNLLKLIPLLKKFL